MADQVEVVHQEELDQVLQEQLVLRVVCREEVQVVAGLLVAVLQVLKAVLQFEELFYTTLAVLQVVALEVPHQEGQTKDKQGYQPLLASPCQEEQVDYQDLIRAGPI